MSVQRENGQREARRKEHRLRPLNRAMRVRKEERATRKRRKEALLNKRQGNISDLTPGRDNDVRIPFASASFEREAIVVPSLASRSRLSRSLIRHDPPRTQPLTIQYDLTQ